METVYILLIIYGSLACYLYVVYLFKHRIISVHEHINDEEAITNPIVCIVAQ